ncbi:MAG: hypothetical protein WB809_04860 [Thermoplasmata archaeon]
MTEGVGGTPASNGAKSGMGAPPTLRRGSPSGLLPFLVLAVVTFFLTWFLFAALTGYPVGIGKPPVSVSSGNSPTGVLLAINNPFDTANNSSTDQYAPANFSVPANTLLEFTITNYDTGQNPVEPVSEANVNGTVDNCIYLNSTPTSLGPCVHSVSPGFVVHTFSFESGPYAGFNIPIPSAINTPSEGGVGTTVTFFAYFNETGTFTWNCLAPCDPFSMQTTGFMTGTMTVVAS